MLGNTLTMNFCHSKIIHILHPRYHSKIIGHTLKNKQNILYVSINEVIPVIMMKMKMKMKNKLHRYDKNKSESRQGHKYSKYKKCVSMMMLLCIKQHLSNIWSSIYEKLSKTEAELKKSVAYTKKARTALKSSCIASKINSSLLFSSCSKLNLTLFNSLLLSS